VWPFTAADAVEMDGSSAERKGTATWSNGYLLHTGSMRLGNKFKYRTLIEAEIRETPVRAYEEAETLFVRVLKGRQRKKDEGESAEGTAPSAAFRTGREPLSSSGSHHPADGRMPVCQ